MESVPGSGWDGSTYSHYSVLLAIIGGRSADEAEGLSYCHDRVVNDGARSASGRWCVCLSEVAPATAESRGRGGDGVAALLCVKADLEYAADSLPISWSTTQRVFETQQRAGAWQSRFLAYRQNRAVREIDRWHEPRDSESGRPKSAALSNYLQSLALGGARTECGWPGAQTPTVGNITVLDDYRRQRASIQQEAA
jgi:hypothetical protein